MKVALLQYNATSDKQANLALAEEMSAEAVAKGAAFILLPEVFNFRGNASDKDFYSSAAEKIPGPSTEKFQGLAKKHNVSILLGSLIEKSAKPFAYNTSVLIGPSGKIEVKYRKIHLFDARIGDKIIRESDFFRSGREPGVAKTGDFLMGLSVCYDLRFPLLYQKYAMRGVDILTVPSCFTKKTGEAHWEPLLRARAIENLAYVLAPNQIGADAKGIQTYGNSMIISPWGEILARGSESKQEIIFGDIHREEIRKARDILPGIIGGGK